MAATRIGGRRVGTHVGVQGAPVERVARRADGGRQAPLVAQGAVEVVPQQDDRGLDRHAAVGDDGQVGPRHLGERLGGQVDDRVHGPRRGGEPRREVEREARRHVVGRRAR